LEREESPYRGVSVRVGLLSARGGIHVLFEKVEEGRRGGLGSIVIIKEAGRDWEPIMLEEAVSK